MVTSETQRAINQSGLSQQSQHVLLECLGNYSAEDQQTFLQMVKEDPRLWAQLAASIKVVQQELSHGTTDMLRQQLTEGLRYAKRKEI